MNSDGSIQLFISDFLNFDINSYSDAQGFFLYDFMDVLDDFNDLWHNDNLFNDLFKNVWNFYNFLN